MNKATIHYFIHISTYVHTFIQLYILMSVASHHITHAIHIYICRYSICMYINNSCILGLCRFLCDRIGSLHGA